MPEAADDFQDLLARARQGDAEAMEQLIRQYEPDVRKAVESRLGRALQALVGASDIVQSIHRSILLGLRNNRLDLSSPGHLRALAFTLVARKMARHWRHRLRQQSLDGESISRADLEQLLLANSKVETDPARIAEQNEQVRHLLDQLAPEDRRVLELRLLGYSTADAARTLGLDPDALRAHLSHLRKRLRELGLLDRFL